MVDGVNVICMKWGHLYGPHYVNRLYRMTKRNLGRQFRFVCFTDDNRGLRDEVETLPLPDIRVDQPHQDLAWRKLSVFQAGLGGLAGTTLFLDLDIVITDSLDPFFEFPGEFCIIHNWTHPHRIVGNSSVFRFEIGAHQDVLRQYLEKPTQHWVDLYRNEQTFLSHMLGPERLTYWPSEWCVSFKKHCLPGGPFGLWNWFRTAGLPHGARIVAFHGSPKPDEAMAGVWPGGWYKHTRPVPWISRYWVD